MKNILVITTSLRRNSNSAILASAFARGAAEAGHHVETVSLAEAKIGFCRGCLACQKAGRCVIDDDAAAIAEKMEHADVLVFATPIYYYEMSGQMKTLLDRANPLYPKDYAFRDVYLAAAAAEDGDEVWSKAASGLQGWLDCFPKARLAGVMFAGGVTDAGEAAGHAALEKAIEAGRNA